jgi:hypothetical protein
LKRTSEEWDKRLTKPLGITILDPDGWDRKNYQYSFKEELITAEEFRDRVYQSTCMSEADNMIKFGEKVKEQNNDTNSR